MQSGVNSVSVLRKLTIQGARPTCRPISIQLCLASPHPSHPKLLRQSFLITPEMRFLYHRYVAYLCTLALWSATNLNNILDFFCLPKDQFLPLLGDTTPAGNTITTCLPALLANSADLRHLLLHVLLTLGPFLLLTFSKYASLGQTQTGAQDSRGFPGAWGLISRF